MRFRVTPNARQTAFNGLIDIGDGQTALKVSLNAPPAGGKANKALITLIAKNWHLPKSTISIKSGETSRIKTVLIEGDGAALQTAVQTWMQQR